MPDIPPRGRVTVALDGRPQVSVEVDLLATALTSLVEFFGPLRHRAPPTVSTWARRRARGLPLPALLRLLTDPFRAGLPNFFGLTESQGDLTFDERLDLLRSTSSARMNQDFASYFDSPTARADLYRDWLDSPDRALRNCCDLLKQYWDEVVCEVYPQPVRRITDQAHRLRTLAAQDDPSAAAVATNAQLSVNDRHITMLFLNPHAFDRRPERPRQNLVLKPMICAPVTRVSNIPFEDELQLVVAASTPSLSSWQLELQDADVVVPLASLLGVMRSRIISSLTRRAATTTELADELDIALSTVSHHVGLLARAGVVSSVRTGHSVSHYLTDRGFHLLQI